MILRILSALLALTAVTSAQDLYVTISPAVTQPGQAITFTALDTQNQGLFTPGGALLSQVRSGSPTGPTVAVFPGTLLPVAVPQCAPGATPRTQTWTPSANIGPGTYWVEIITTIGMFGPFMYDHYCVVIEDPAAPSAKLTPDPTTSPSPGSTYLLEISDADPGAQYLLGLSASTNTGIAGTCVCLDMDAVFALSFPAPSPTLFFGFAGSIDGFGAATGIGISLPPLPAGVCIPLCAQVVTFGGFQPGLNCTNVHYFAVQ